MNTPKKSYRFQQMRQILFVLMEEETILIIIMSKNF